MTRYAIVIRHRAADWETKPPAEQRRILDRYFAWLDELTARGAAVDSQPLRDGGRIMQVVDGEIVDGPFTETKEVVGGFVLIEAKGWDEARALARSCPALAVGDWIELREVSVFNDPRDSAPGDAANGDGGLRRT